MTFAPDPKLTALVQATGNAPKCPSCGNLKADDSHPLWPDDWKPNGPDSVPMGFCGGNCGHAGPRGPEGPSGAPPQPTATEETNSLLRFQTIDDVAAHHKLELHPAIPWANETQGMALAAAGGWVQQVYTPRYTFGADRPFTPEDCGRLTETVARDLIYGIDTRCAFEPGKYHHVTGMTLVCDNNEAWGFIYLK